MESVAPLSPYMWDYPKQDVVPPGSVAGKVADTLLHFSDMNLRFDLIVKEYAAPYNHPVFEAYEKHPVHTSALNRRQFDLMRYGMVLDREERLVLIQAPRSNSDSGVRVATEFNAIFHEDLDNTEISKHPLLPEYCFLVCRLPSEEDVKAAGGAAIPEVLFRLVFRNEAFNESGIFEMCDQFPLFRLRSVYVSQTMYYPILQDIYSHRTNHPDVFRTQEGKVLPHPRMEQLLQRRELTLLCEAWLRVLEGIAPSWVHEKGVGPDVVNLFLATHRAKNGGAVQDRKEDYTTERVPNCVRLSYFYNKDRMRQRVQVIRREPGMLTPWREGAYDVQYYALENDGPEPAQRSAPCARILMRLTRSGQNDLVDGEICAYVPQEWEYKNTKVYRTAAAERLRLWILKGLMTAEIQGVHAVLLDMDTTLLLSQCVGLLWGGEEEDRQREVTFHVCKIVVETVEDYVQHSGVVWKVTIVVSDENSRKASALCEEILELVQTTKARVEVQERLRYVNREREEAERLQRRELLETHAREQVAKKGGAGSTYYDRVLDRILKGEAGALVPYNASATIPWNVQGIPQSVAAHARCLGLQMSDSSLFPLFESLCKYNEDTIPVQTLVNLLLSKLSPEEDERYRFWPHDHPLLALDNCGIPCNVTSVTNFVMGFSLRPYRGKSTGTAKGRPTPAPEEHALNYVEFSMMMLALVYQ